MLQEQNKKLVIVGILFWDFHHKTMNTAANTLSSVLNPGHDTSDNEDDGGQVK